MVMLRKFRAFRPKEGLEKEVASPRERGGFSAL